MASTLHGNSPPPVYSSKPLAGGDTWRLRTMRMRAGSGVSAPARRKWSCACVPPGRSSIAPCTSVSVCELSAESPLPPGEGQGEGVPQREFVAESCTSASNGPQEPASVRCKHCQIRSSEAASTSGCEAVIASVGRHWPWASFCWAAGDLQQPATKDRLAGLGIGHFELFVEHGPGPEVLQAAELHVQAQLPAKLLGLPPGRIPADAGSGTSRRPAAPATRPTPGIRRRTAGGGLYREAGTSLFTGNEEDG